MSQYSWPDPATRPLLGKSINRVDGPVKSSGRAKYTYDYNPKGLLAGKILGVAGVAFTQFLIWACSLALLSAVGLSMAAVSEPAFGSVKPKAARN